MKNLFSFPIYLLCVCTLFSCEKGVLESPHEKASKVSSADYLTELKNYKNSEHQIMAGYYRTWGDSLVEHDSGQRTMLAIPDSVDIVNVFADYTPPESPYWTALKDTYIPYLHERGTRVVVTSGLPNSNVTVLSDDSLSKWVDGFVSNNNNRNYDGIDLDFEAGGGTTSTGLYGGFFRGTQNDLNEIKRRIVALSNYFGPKSSSGKLFILDLNFVNLPADFLKGIEPYIDYFFMQRYFGGQLDKLYTEAYAGNVPTKKYVLGASFEDGSARNGTPALFYQYASWNPAEGTKGGIFSYGLDADGTYSTPSYIFTKTAIQMMNPANN